MFIRTTDSMEISGSSQAARDNTYRLGSGNGSSLKSLLEKEPAGFPRVETD